MISRCTRWYLPLLLLPLPTAPPYFLILFLFSLTLHARPCFYCIILLTALFLSSCYWQPWSLTSPLSVPWADNITTFADALNASISKPETPISSVIRVVDRCWCDFSTHSIFEPFNISNWEKVSVERMAEELELQNGGGVDVPPDESDLESSCGGEERVNPPQDGEPGPLQEIAPPASHLPVVSNWIPISSFFTRKFKPNAPDHPPLADSPPILEAQPSTHAPAPPSPTEHHDIPLLRRVYDLRPYGLDLVIDFGWSRNDLD